MISDHRVSYPRSIINGLRKLQEAVLTEPGSTYIVGMAAAYVQMLEDTTIPRQHCWRVIEDVNEIIRQIENVDNQYAQLVTKALRAVTLDVLIQHEEYKTTPPLRMVV